MTLFVYYYMYSLAILNQYYRDARILFLINILLYCHTESQYPDATNILVNVLYRIYIYTICNSSNLSSNILFSFTCFKINYPVV